MMTRRSNGEGEPARERKRPPGRPPSETTREYGAIKLDRRLIPMARAVAQARGVTLGEYISARFGPVIEQDFYHEMQRIGGGKK